MPEPTLKGGLARSRGATRRAPTASELAGETGASVEQILELRIARDAQRGDSLGAEFTRRRHISGEARVGVHELRDYPRGSQAACRMKHRRAGPEVQI
jgi:hypothetical protein